MRCTEELRQSRAANRRTLVHCNAGVSNKKNSYTPWSVFIFSLWGLPTFLSIISFMELAFTINLCSDLGSPIYLCQMAGCEGGVGGGVAN
jgi:hypothetical protein